MTIFYSSFEYLIKYLRPAAFTTVNLHLQDDYTFIIFNSSCSNISPPWMDSRRVRQEDPQFGTQIKIQRLDTRGR